MARKKKSKTTQKQENWKPPEELKPFFTLLPQAMAIDDGGFHVHCTLSFLLPHASKNDVHIQQIDLMEGRLTFPPELYTSQVDDDGVPIGLSALSLDQAVDKVVEWINEYGFKMVPFKPMPPLNKLPPSLRDKAKKKWSKKHTLRESKPMFDPRKLDKFTKEDEWPMS